MKRFLSFTFCLIGSVLYSGISTGQGGGFGGGGDPFGGAPPMEVVILLGNDYDFQKPPFVSAQEIVRAFGRGQNGVYMPSAPTLATVRVDVTSEVSDSGNRSVVAEYSSDLEGAVLDAFKQKTKLNALRFGINEVTFVAADAAGENGARVWLREPYYSEQQLLAESQTLLEISNTLSVGDGDTNTPPRKVRLDLFAAKPRSTPHDYHSDMGMGVMPVMSSMGMEGEYGGDMMMDMGDGPPSPEELSDQLAANESKRAEFKKRVDAIVAEISQPSGGDKETLRRQLAEVVRADIKLEQANRDLVLRQMEQKLEKLRRRLRSEEAKAETTSRERVEELLKKGHSL